MTRVPRFSRAVRAVHWSLAALTLVCVGTAAVLYNNPLAVLVGHRHAVELVHVYCGLAIPVPLFLGLLAASYRADLRSINRFTPADWRWLRSKSRRDGAIRVGKFNAGQKLNAALSAGGLLVLFGTGVLMYFTGLVRLAWRTGATFVHDWAALALGILIIGHLTYALRDVEARAGMRHGHVSRTWARREHAAWADEIDT